MFTMTNNHGIGFCLSTDEKPVSGINNGDEVKEMDTGKVYHFDEENSTWIEWSATAEES